MLSFNSVISNFYIFKKDFQEINQNWAIKKIFMDDRTLRHKIKKSIWLKNDNNDNKNDMTWQ